MNYTTTRECIEWISIRWHEEEATAGLSRVLLVGDSIVVGHGTILSDMLKGKFGVDYFATSRIVSDRDYLPELEFMLKKYRYAMIIFNNGLHGIEVEDPIYAEGLERVMRYLSKQTRQLAWRNNTPCFPAPGRPSAIAWSDRVPKRNALALEVAEKLGVPAIDAYSLFKDKPELSSDDGVHFNLEGNTLLAQKEADHIIRLL